jgi:hypothetical protein
MLPIYIWAETFIGNTQADSFLDSDLLSPLAKSGQLSYP